MVIVRIVGTLEYEDTIYCDCEWCEGHGGTGKWTTVEIDKVIKMYNWTAPIPHSVYPDTTHDFEWIVGPHLLDPPPDQVMRLIGAPTLL